MIEHDFEGSAEALFCNRNMPDGVNGLCGGLRERHIDQHREPSLAQTLIRDHAFRPYQGDVESCGWIRGQGSSQWRCGEPPALHGNPGRNPYEGKSLEIMESEEFNRPKRDLVRTVDVAQYAREPIPDDQRGQIRVRLLNATPDPLGSIAALCGIYEGRVVRSLAEVTDEQRRAAFEAMQATVLNGPLEAVQFHFLIEGVTRSITHQMVRSRASFFAQESLRFAVPEGQWDEEIPLPPSLQGKDSEAKSLWQMTMSVLQDTYDRLINAGVPAEEARGVLPHDMPTRLHWVCDLRTLLADAGKRTCTQAQFPWRLIFAGIAKALRSHSSTRQWGNSWGDGWQFTLIADRLRPVCYQTGSCGFMAKFDRGCSIRQRVDAFAKAGVSSVDWSKGYAGEGLFDFEGQDAGGIPAIQDWEWAADPAAARVHG